MFRNPGSSFQKVEIETDRLLQLLDSIKENGYNPQFQDALNCFILVKNNKWKWIVESGQHRICVLRFLGYKKVAAHVRRIIRREEVALWPGVVKGVFSEEEALEIFDRIFKNKAPAKAENWINYVKTLNI